MGKTGLVAGKFAAILMVLLVGSVGFLFNNCAGPDTSGAGAPTVNPSSGCTINIAESLKDPQTIDQAVLLINALPKPLTIDCFLLALKRPLKVYAVNNTNSAQPAVSVNSPRIFVINNKLLLSVVPAGTGRSFLELSEVVGANVSVKGEIQFPIVAALPAATPYTSILDPRLSGATSCKICHSGESRNTVITTGEAYNSLLVRPDSFKRVSQPYLKEQAEICDPSLQAFRCAMLKAIFIDGQAQDGDFP